MSCKSIISLFSVVCLLSLSSTSRSQDEVKGTVSGVGTVTVKHRPKLIRMTIQISGKAKTIKEALAKLKDRRDASKILLKSLAADKDSISFSDPRLSAADNNQQRQMERALLRSKTRGGRVPKGLQIQKSVSVSCTLTAHWALKYKDTEELLLIASDLQERVAAADLAGLKEPKKLSPEEQELAEEMAAMTSNYNEYGGSEVKPGEPRFVYVARISADERAAAMSQAFTKAKLQATELAKAAGSNLGTLTQIKQQSGGVGGNVDQYYAYQMRRRLMTSTGTTDENEALSPVPGLVSFGFVVEASFRLNSK